MCKVVYNRIQCSAPIGVKRATNCQGKVREQSHANICIQYCDTRQVVEERNGGHRWGKGLCRPCHEHAKANGMASLLGQYDERTGFFNGIQVKGRPGGWRQNTPSLSGRASRRQ